MAHSYGFTWILTLDPSGKLLHNYGNSPCLMGKLTVSMAIFNSKLLVTTRGYVTVYSSCCLLQRQAPASFDGLVPTVPWSNVARNRLWWWDDNNPYIYI